eukprot:gnl/Chilomastix_cuspidata/2018.p1 GENE.gnl/Chilomastix_cuspidata/2018~~gnl/Chilomastix_cuspidata/2018.p1  ORF type:complete len:1526 (-),score=215.16 gnl/Chilomastix_cuspidata/2018:2656-7164(-)
MNFFLLNKNMLPLVLLFIQIIQQVSLHGMSQIQNPSLDITLIKILSSCVTILSIVSPYLITSPFFFKAIFHLILILSVLLTLYVTCFNNFNPFSFLFSFSSTIFANLSPFEYSVQNAYIAAHSISFFINLSFAREHQIAYTNTVALLLSLFFCFRTEVASQNLDKCTYIYQQEISTDMTKRLKTAFGFGFRKLPRSCFVQFLSSDPGKTLSIQNVSILFLRLKTTKENGTFSFLDYHSYIYKLDWLTQKLGLEKIKSTGSDYIVASGIEFDEEQQRQHKSHATIAASISKLLSFIVQASSVAETFPCQSCISAGLVFGPVFSSVLGLYRLEFDIWGTTVNHAARLLSFAGDSELLMSMSVRPFLPEELSNARIINASLKGISDTQCISVPIRKQSYQDKWVYNSQFRAIKAKMPPKKNPPSSYFNTPQNSSICYSTEFLTKQDSDIAKRPFFESKSVTRDPSHTFSERPIKSVTDMKTSLSFQITTSVDSAPPSTIWPLLPIHESSLETIVSSDSFSQKLGTQLEKVKSKGKNINDLIKSFENNPKSFSKKTKNTAETSDLFNSSSNILIPKIDEIVDIVTDFPVPILSHWNENNSFDVRNILLTLFVLQNVMAVALSKPSEHRTETHKNGTSLHEGDIKESADDSVNVLEETSIDFVSSSGFWGSSVSRSTHSSGTKSFEVNDNHFLRFMINSYTSLYCPRNNCDNAFPTFLKENLPSHSMSAYYGMAEFLEKSFLSFPNLSHYANLKKNFFTNFYLKMKVLFDLLRSVSLFSTTAMNQATFAGQIRGIAGKRISYMITQLFSLTILFVLRPSNLEFYSTKYDKFIWFLVDFGPFFTSFFCECLTLLFLRSIDRITTGQSKKSTIARFRYTLIVLFECLIYSTLFLIQMFKVKGKFTIQNGSINAFLNPKNENLCFYLICCSLNYYRFIIFLTSGIITPQASNFMTLFPVGGLLLIFMAIAFKTLQKHSALCFLLPFIILIIRLVRATHSNLISQSLWIQWFYSIILAKLLLGFLPEKSVEQMFRTNPLMGMPHETVANILETKQLRIIRKFLFDNPKTKKQHFDAREKQREHGIGMAYEIFPLPTNEHSHVEIQGYLESLLSCWKRNLKSEIPPDEPSFPLPLYNLKPPSEFEGFHTLHAFASITISHKKSFSMNWEHHRKKSQKTTSSTLHFFTRADSSFFVMPIPRTIHEDVPFCDTHYIMASQLLNTVKMYQSQYLQENDKPSHFLFPTERTHGSIDTVSGNWRGETARRTLPDFYPLAACIQADIVGFTSFSSRNELKEVGTVIFMLFSLLDEIVKEEKLAMKIKTLGDGYQILLGEPFPTCPHNLEAIINYTERAANMALEMIRRSKSLFEDLGHPELALSAGISVSPIFAEMMGYIRCTMDLFGTGIEEAALLESLAPKNSVLISVSAYILLRCTDSFCFSEQIVFVRSKKVKGVFEKVQVSPVEFFLPLDSFSDPLSTKFINQAWLVSKQTAPTASSETFRLQLKRCISNFYS